MENFETTANKPQVNSGIADFWSNDCIENLTNSKFAVNVKNKDDRYELSVVAPGLKSEDFRIAVEKGILSISANPINRDEVKSENIKNKFCDSSVIGSFNMPKDTCLEKVVGTYQNGLFKVIVMKLDKLMVKSKKVHLVNEKFSHGQYFRR